MAESAPEPDLRAIEQQLRSRLAETEDRIAELTKPPEAAADIGFGKRIGDGTNEAMSRFTEVGVANDLHTMRKRIERALEIHNLQRWQQQAEERVDSLADELAHLVSSRRMLILERIL